MSVLDTFFLMFEGNSEGAKKAADEAVNAGNKAFEAIKKTEAASVEAAKKIGTENTALAQAFDLIAARSSAATSKIVLNLEKVAASFLGLFAVEKLISGAFKQAFKDWGELNDAQEFGTSVENLDAWEKSVKRVGGSADGFAQSIKGINERIARLAVTGAKGGRAKIFEELGIDVKQGANAFDYINQISTKLHNMPVAQARAIGRSIGFDDGTLRLLRMGPEAIQKIIDKEKQFGVLTKEEAEQGKKFALEWLNLKTDLDEIFRILVLAIDTFLLPALTMLIEPVHSFVGFIAQHKDLVIGAFIAIGIAALIAGEALGVFSKAAAVLEFLLSPVTLIVGAVFALIAAFALLYDDLEAFANGNNSITGELVKRWPIVGEVIHGVAEAFGEMKDFAVEAFQIISALVERIPEGFRQWEGIIGGLSEYLKGAFEELPEPIKAVFTELGNVLKVFADAAHEVAGFMPEGFKLAFDVILDQAKITFELLKAVFMLIADLVVNPQHAFENFAERMKAIVGLIGGDFSKLGEEFAHLLDSLIAMAGRIAAIFGGIGDKVGHLVSSVGSAAQTVGNWFGGHVHATNPAVAAAAGNSLGEVASGIGAASGALAATNTPIAAQTPLSLGAGVPTAPQQSNSVTVGSVTIQTAATDAAGIKDAFAQELEKHYQDTMPHFADGVSH